jgi:lipoyl(octanoyl) transferase
MSTPDYLVVRQLGRIDYQQCWRAMQAFTDERDDTVADEIWLLEHQRVFTQGQAGKAEHVLAAGDIPVMQVDRGGQVTYHGPGQLVAYLMIDMRRLGWGVRELVDAIEHSIIAVLATYGVSATARADAPGVYLDAGAKIAALGLRVRRGCSFHGLALNLDLDLEPFGRINPCGYAGQAVSRLKDLVTDWREDEMQQLGQQLVDQLAATMGYGRLRPCQGLPACHKITGDSDEG